MDLSGFMSKRYFPAARFKNIGGQIYLNCNDLPKNRVFARCKKVKYPFRLQFQSQRAPPTATNLHQHTVVSVVARRVDKDQ
jgi:hypothetical protein